jgi:PAS domain S-box-containing protein
MSETLVKNSDELRERRKYIETVLQSLSTGVISLDAEDRITTINKAAVAIFNLEDTDFDNQKLDSIVSAENFGALEKLLSRAKRFGHASEQTILHRERAEQSDAPSENLPVAMSAAALSLRSGDEKGVVLVIEDLSELIAAQRASAWQEVARRMAHEIKNPLTPIQLAAERISKNFHKNFVGIGGNGLHSNPSDQSAKLEKIVDESTETILREVSSLKSMVDEFSRYARLPDASLEEGDLNEILKQSIALYQDRELEFELDLDEKLPNAAIDLEQIKRVFVNLIENSSEAFDAKQIGKKIFAKTFHDAARGLIVAQISDNGGGIRPQDIQRIFQPYFSTKGRGTGLGLAIVQRIILEHGGKIHVSANSPKGTKFIVELPVTG